jgi:uncharacterized protein YegL
MKKNYTHIGVVLDRSGSMQSCWTDVVGGYKSLVEDNKKADGECTMTVAVFDTEYDLVEDFSDIKKVDENLKVLPRGGTALLDAVGKTISIIGEKLSTLSENDRPEKVLLVIQTDGQENSSNEFNKDQIKNMISEQTTKYNWVFQFIGADLQSISEAQSWGISKSFTASYNTSKSGTTFGLVSEKLLKARSAPIGEYAASFAFSEEDRTKIS